MATKKNKVQLHIENLEDRNLMSTTSILSGTELRITASGSQSRSQVYDSGNQIVFQDLETYATARYTRSSIAKIKFTGGGGNDTFANWSDIASDMNGNGGNDSLRGGDADDTIRGGSGNDTLVGLDGNDNLYGGAGTDQLNGGAGLDGLFGGGWTENDSLYGGSGADRFLVQNNNSGSDRDTITDKDSIDAKIKFINPTSDRYDSTNDITWAKSTWTDGEIEGLDVAFRNMHLITSNTKFLKYARNDSTTVRDLEFRRYGDPSKSTSILGWNWTDTGKIDLTNRTYNLGTTWVLQTLYHEVGHNFDAEHENPFARPFQNLSGWVKGNPGTTRGTYFLGIRVGTESTHLAGTDPNDNNGDNWYYHRDAQFARDYGKYNPYEDFATSFAAYFMKKYHGTYNGDGEVTAKHASIDNLLYHLRTPEKVTLKDPGATTNDNTPYFWWTQSTNVKRYELWLTNLTTNQRVLYKTDISGNGYTATSTLADGNYRFWVRAIGDNGAAGDWSASKDFTIDTRPGTATLLGPVGTGDDTTPTFTWNAANNATHYELWVTNMTTNRRVLHLTNVNGTSYTATAELANGDYRFWVRAHNGTQTGLWSAFKAFTINKVASVNELRDQYGFWSTGELHHNFFGQNEKWFKDKDNVWHYIKADGSIYRNTGGRDYAKLDTVDTSAYTQMERLLLTEAEQTHANQLKQQHDFKFAGSFYLNFFGKNEKWFKDRNDVWHYIKEDGSIYRNAGGANYVLLTQVDRFFYAATDRLF